MKKLNMLKAAVAMTLAAGSYQAQAASATYDPVTQVVDIPVVDVRSGSSVTTFTAQLQLTASGQLELISASPVASATGERVTYFQGSNKVHFPTVEVLGSNSEFYAQLSLVPAAGPLTFNLDQLGTTSFIPCPDFSDAGPVPGTCLLSGEINQDITLTANTTWILSGGVFIGGDNSNPSTLTVNPGTEVVGQQGADFLYIRRGSQIVAEGTPDSPIVFTGPLEQAAGEWGGLIIAGNAPVNGCADTVAVCENVFEAITTESFGGNDTAESSGTLKFVQIKFAGFEVRPDEELNGLTMLGVGSGTSVDYVQVHAGLDDGVEMFGGTVQMKHLVLTDIGDDSLDWGSGWRGKAQFVLIRQAADDGDRGIEADNNGDDNDSLPRSMPLLANLTAIGSEVTSQGALLRRGTGVEIYNSVFTGFGDSCIRFDGEATYLNTGTPTALTGEMVMQNTFLNCDLNTRDDEEVATFTVLDWFNAQPGNVEADPQLDGVFPAAGSPLINSSVMVSDSFIENVSYSGAFSDASDSWADEWTVGGIR